MDLLDFIVIEVVGLFIIVTEFLTINLAIDY